MSKFVCRVLLLLSNLGMRDEGVQRNLNPRVGTAKIMSSTVAYHEAIRNLRDIKT